MNIFYPIPDSDEYDRLYCPNKEDRGILGELRFSSQPNHSWESLPVEIDPAGKSGDFPSISGHQLVFSQRAWQVLKPIVEKSAEALPLICASGNYFVINVFDIVDCLDLSNAQVSRFSDGRLMRIKSYAFKEGCIGDRNIFKLPQPSDVLVTQTFKDVVEKNDLEGLIFRKVA